MYRYKWRKRSAENVLSEIQELRQKYAVAQLEFEDDNLTLDYDRAMAIFEGLCRLQEQSSVKLTWGTPNGLRAETVDRAMLNLMKRSGCAELTFGVESGSDRILTLIDKDIRVCDVLEAHSRAKKFGFRVNYHFMIGFPGETRSDIRETAKLISRLLTSYEHTNTFGPSIYVPYPGTPLFDRSVEMGFNPPDTLEGWISYDWQQTPAFPWFSNWDKRYLKEVQTVSMMAKTVPSSVRRLTKWQ